MCGLAVAGGESSLPPWSGGALLACLCWVRKVRDNVWEAGIEFSRLAEAPRRRIRGMQGNFGRV